MKAEGLASGRLPQNVVLAETRAGPPAKEGTGTADVSPQNDIGDVAVRLPAIADLPGQIGTVYTRLPIPLVRIEAGLKAAGEQVVLAVKGAPSQGGVDQVLNDHESVACKGFDLVVRQLE